MLARINPLFVFCYHFAVQGDWKTDHCVVPFSTDYNCLVYFCKNITVKFVRFLEEARVSQVFSSLCLSPLKNLSQVWCGVSRERVPVVDLSCALGVFLRVLGFSSLKSTQCDKILT